MARATGGPPVSTPSLQKSGTGGKNQTTLFGFFQRTPTSASTDATLPDRSSSVKTPGGLLGSAVSQKVTSSQLTPAASSDQRDQSSPIQAGISTSRKASLTFQPKCLPSPVSSADGAGQTNGDLTMSTAGGTPSRRVRLSSELAFSEKQTDNP